MLDAKELEMIVGTLLTRNAELNEQLKQERANTLHNHEVTEKLLRDFNAVRGWHSYWQKKANELEWQLLVEMTKNRDLCVGITKILGGTHV